MKSDSPLLLITIDPTNTLNLIHYFQGGIKAVVHTDAWQVMVMFISVVVVVTIGTIAIGGPAEVFEKALYGERIQFFK